MDTSTRDLNGEMHPTLTTDTPPFAILTAVAVFIAQAPLKCKHNLHDLIIFNGKNDVVVCCC